MNKEEFVAFIAKEHNTSKAEAERALDMVIASITKAISNKQDISLIGFGSFYIQARKAREGHNPQTGKAIKIEAYNLPAFKAGKKLKDGCNA